MALRRRLGAPEKLSHATKHHSLDAERGSEMCRDMINEFDKRILAIQTLPELKALAASCGLPPSV